MLEGDDGDAYMMFFYRRLCDGEEPRRLWLEEEDNGGVGWRRMMAVAIGTTLVHLLISRRNSELPKRHIEFDV
ncbi:hypothetical protein Tco_1167068 [Tanacetum coccineum]